MKKKNWLQILFDPITSQNVVRISKDNNENAFAVQDTSMCIHTYTDCDIRKQSFKYSLYTSPTSHTHIHMERILNFNDSYHNFQ